MYFTLFFELKKLSIKIFKSWLLLWSTVAIWKQGYTNHFLIHNRYVYITDNSKFLQLPL